VRLGFVPIFVKLKLLFSLKQCFLTCMFVEEDKTDRTPNQIKSLRCEYTQNAADFIRQDKNKTILEVHFLIL
jgi:hypothetical protein